MKLEKQSGDPQSARTTRQNDLSSTAASTGGSTTPKFLLPRPPKQDPQVARIFGEMNDYPISYGNANSMQSNIDLSLSNLDKILTLGDMSITHGFVLVENIDSAICMNKIILELALTTRSGILAPRSDETRPWWKFHAAIRDLEKDFHSFMLPTKKE